MTGNGTPTTRDIIVIGGSSGGTESLAEFIPRLPIDLPATIFIVQHSAATTPSLLPKILAHRTQLPIEIAAHGVEFATGVLYVADANRHLMLRDGHIVLSNGPRENGFRPAIDPLFRSAAAHFGPRVIGVLLSGYLDDGVSGLEAIGRCGGCTVVQDPDDAAVPDLPRNALDAINVDHRVSREDMAARLTQLTHEPAGAARAIPDDVRLEAAIAETGMSDESHVSAIGAMTSSICPDCGGPLWDIEDEGVQRYRCHTGHAYTARHLIESTDHAVERALYSAYRILEDRVKMLNNIIRNEERNGRGTLAQVYRRRAAEAAAEAQELRNLILHMNFGGAAGQYEWENEGANGGREKEPLAGNS